MTQVERLEAPITVIIPAAYEVLRGQIRRSERLYNLFFRETPEYPTFAWQEAIVNAVAHRDDRFVVVLRNAPIFESADETWAHLVERLASNPAHRRVLLAHPQGFTNEQYREVNAVDRDEAYRQISEMVAAGIVLTPGRPGRGARYRLCADLLETRSWLEQRLPEVRRHLEEHGSLTKADYRHIFGETRYVAVPELRRLVEEGVLELRGERRGAHYVSGPRIDVR